MPLFHLLPETGARTVRSGEAMPLGLHDVVIIDSAKLANRTIHGVDEIGIRQRASADLERRVKKSLQIF